jgi:hypothetical protein
MKHQGHRLWAVALLIVSALALAACAGEPITPDEEGPAQLQPVAGSSLNRVILTKQAMQDLDIQTTPVGKALSASPKPKPSPSPTATPTPAATPTSSAAPAALTLIPVSAVIYDPQGRPWTYTVAGPRSFVRRAIVIDHKAGTSAFLSSGPPVGTPVVTVGAPELLGAEYGVGKE